MRNVLPFVASVAAMSAFAAAVSGAGAVVPEAGVAGLHAFSSVADLSAPGLAGVSVDTATAEVPAPTTTTTDTGGAVEVRPGEGDLLLVDASIAADVQRLFDDAADAGVVLGGSGWRSHQRQHELREANGCPDDGSWIHTEGEDPSDWVSASRCRVPTARPGSSQHESGFAIDFTYGGKIIGSRESVAFKWLEAHAAGYGLINLASEPWHWSTTGR